MSFQIASCLLFVLATACGTTPLNVVLSQDAGTASDSGAADSGACFVTESGRFVLKSGLNAECLGVGAPTTVFGNPAFETAFGDCGLPAQTWDLSAQAGANVFSFENVISEDSLDVRMAATQSGTPVILYAATGLSNQQFAVRARGASYVELRPQHASSSCVGVAAASAQISPCAPTDSTQTWQLERVDCL
ncbi:MAG TPA: RICIN domain-containing protein [Polyangiaceae bacterium]|nr:RICIN domain-containing protein [Polyangiaceae bacterium]